MGVPKFYRWISERYPCLSEVIKDSQIPEFDNMYLDMNGIIHNCSHPNDDDVTFRITEEQIFEDVFAYIEKLFLIIRPRKVFFMAIDGVAPRAKMNQQRARRFMSARTAQEQLDRAKKKGQDIPSEKRFDPNCITPGTYFMTELHKRLSIWVENKVSSDPAWQGLRIYVSGHDCPGEGEHKIMDFIRAERSADGYDPNTRHCMYGLDADLLMLGICSHEPHFSLLREEVKFSRPIRTVKGKKREHAKRDNPSEITFHLLHLSLLREYLAWEFHPVKEKLSFPYDMERIVDDWILMGFLIGNDFIPHLPHVHIHDDAFPLLYQTYMEILPTLDGYINEAGYLHLKRFEIFLKAFARNDQKCFLQSMEDADFMKSKSSRVCTDLVDEDNLIVFQDWNVSDSPTSTGELSAETPESDAAFASTEEEEEEEEIEQMTAIQDTDILASATEVLSGLNFDPIEDEFSEALSLAQFKEMDDKDFENDVQNCWTKSISNSFRRHKRDYYKQKMKLNNITKTQLREQAEGYVRAIQWNLHYYYHGCVSWNWFYPHHYAPYISDVVDFTNMGMEFELSSPFRPFEQLLAVLPSASAECLPPSLRDLMCNSESPIADFYPTDFETDLNGKKNDWEAVVLIPFIDERRLLEAISSLSNKLTEEENCRNTHGGHLLFTWDVSKNTGERATRSLLPVDKFRIAENGIVWGLLPNVKLDVYFPGFPTMKHLPHSGHLKEVSAKVFQQPTRKPSMVLTVNEREEYKKDLLEIAFDLIGKEVCINWPFLKMGKVDSIWGPDKKYELKNGKVTMIEMTSAEILFIRKMLQEQKESQLSRFAIEVNSPSLAIAFVRPFLGVTYIVDTGILRPQKQWGGVETVVPVLLPLVITNVIVEQRKCLGEISVEQAYPKNSKVFVMEPSWEGFGFPAIVDTIQNSGKSNCRVVVVAAIGCEPDIRRLIENYDQLSLSWMNVFEAGKRTGISPHILSRITGTLFLADDDKVEKESNSTLRLNIGLSLKLSKRNLEVVDYTRRTHDGFWQYSSLCIRLLTEYRNKFRDLFTYLERNNTANDMYYADDIWKNERSRKERITVLSEWLCSLPTHYTERQEGGTEYVDRVIIGHLENAIKKIPSRMEFKKSSINPSRLYRAALIDRNVRPEAEANFRLLDRVVYTLQDLVVPFGLQGTVVGILSDKVDVLFDKEFRGGITIRGNLASGARVLISSLINISFGRERRGNRNNTGLRIKKPINREDPNQCIVRSTGASSSWVSKNDKKGIVTPTFGTVDNNVLLTEKLGSFPHTILKRVYEDTNNKSQANDSKYEEKERCSTLDLLSSATNLLPKKDKINKQLPDWAHYLAEPPQTIDDTKVVGYTMVNKEMSIDSHKSSMSNHWSWRDKKMGEHMFEQKGRDDFRNTLQSEDRKDRRNIQRSSHVPKQNPRPSPPREHSATFSQMENIALRDSARSSQGRHHLNNNRRNVVPSSFAKDLKLTDMKPSTVTVPRWKEKNKKQQRVLSTSNNRKSDFVANMEPITEQKKEIGKDTLITTMNQNSTTRSRKRRSRLAAKFNNQ